MALSDNARVQAESISDKEPRYYAALNNNSLYYVT